MSLRQQPMRGSIKWIWNAYNAYAAKPRPAPYADRGLIAFAQLQLTAAPLALVQPPVWVMPCPGVEVVLPL